MSYSVPVGMPGMSAVVKDWTIKCFWDQVMLEKVSLSALRIFYSSKQGGYSSGA